MADIFIPPLFTQTSRLPYNYPMRDFEKISFEQFSKDIAPDRDLYDSIIIPQRDSASTAGYDLHLLSDISLAPGEIAKIPTGLKSRFQPDEMLLLIVRSGTGFKYNIRLCNQVGVIDADYYNNPDNEGHLWIKIQNEDAVEHNFKKGDALVQGIFVKYLTTDSDQDRNQERRSSY
jgi:dUTP pyrophosphatase